MLPNSNNIKIACKKIYKLLASTKRLTFKQLQKLSGLNDINLCMANLHLLRNNKILQFVNGNEVCYKITT